MKCHDAQELLHPYSDGELDLVQQLEMEQHLAECTTCAEQEIRLRSLRDTASSPSLYYRAPAALRTRLQTTIPSVTQGRQLSRWQLVATAAGLLLLIGVSGTIGMFVSNSGIDSGGRIAEQIVAGHVRSLQVEHAIDIASSDRHTVKPWFHGKLDFSPQVPDLASQGYVLSGGRLDYLVDRPVAAIVYYRRLHAINVFIWPAANHEDRPLKRESRQGFHIRHWQRMGMTYWAISDLNDQELDEFVRLFNEQPPTSSH